MSLSRCSMSLRLAVDVGAGLLVIGVMTVPDTATLAGAVPKIGVEPLLVTAAAKAAGSMARG